MRTSFTATILTLTVGALVVGCGSSSKTAAVSTHAATPAHKDPPNLTGSYVRTVTKSDMTRTQGFRHEGPGGTLPPTGVYHLTLTPNTFRATDPTGFAIAQTYSATPAGKLSVILYVNPDQASFCGPDIPQYASYGWHLSAGALTLMAKTDACADRDSILQGRWTRVGS